PASGTPVAGRRLRDVIVRRRASCAATITEPREHAFGDRAPAASSDSTVLERYGDGPRKRAATATESSSTHSRKRPAATPSLPTPPGGPASGRAGGRRGAG